MREIVLHKRFLKDLRKLKLTQTQAETYKTILVNCSILPKESRDHKLIGNYSDFREFHIGGDIVVIYFFDERNNRIIFTRIGSHSELFKK